MKRIAMVVLGIPILAGTMMMGMFYKKAIPIPYPGGDHRCRIDSFVHGGQTRLHPSA